MCLYFRAGKNLRFFRIFFRFFRFLGFNVRTVARGTLGTGIRLSWSLASHSYADDVQSYKHCSASGAASAIRTMSQATDALNAWMSSNRLLLNPHKTQYIWL